MRTPEAENLELTNPLTLGIALGFTLLYGVIVFASEFLLSEVSEASVQLVGSVSGINDVDAITLATANLVKDGMAPAVGAQTVLLAVSVNTIAEAGLAWRLGGAWYRRTVSAGLVPASILGFLFWAL